MKLNGLNTTEEKAINKASRIETVASIVAALSAVIMCWSLHQNSKALTQSTKALELTRQSFDLQRQDFQIRNRPYIVLSNPRFGENTKDRSNHTWSRSVLVDFSNVSDIPATQVRPSMKLFLDGKEIREEQGSYTTCMRDQTITVPFGLTEAQYDAAQAGSPFWIDYKLTYSGMLSESPEHFSTAISYIYATEVGGFLSHTNRIK